MATIGNITVAFAASLDGLESGVKDVSALLNNLKDDVDDISSKIKDASGEAIAPLRDDVEKVVKSFDDLKAKAESVASTLSSTSTSMKASVDTSDIQKASKDVDELKSNIEDESPEVKVAVSGSIGGAIFSEASARAKEYGQSLIELGKSAGSAVKSAASAATAVGGILDGTSASVSGVIVAVGRAQRSISEWEEVAAAAAAATGVFWSASGGLRTIMAAVGGNINATRTILAAFGAAATAATVSVVAFSAVTAIARRATSGLSDEARSVVARWASFGAAVAAAAVSTRAARAVFSGLRTTLSESSTWAEFLSASMRNASSSVTSFAASATRYLSGVVNVIAIARVASGEFRESMRRLGEEAEGIRNMADRFGSTVEQMLILDYAARAAGVGMSQLARASQAFYTNLSKVRIGQLNTDEAYEAKFAFDRLGVSLDELQNKTPQQVFATVASKLVGIEDAADRAAIAFDLFGRQAVNILPALKGLREAEADSRRLGTTLSGLNFSMFEDVDNAFDRASEAAGNFGEAMAVGFAPLQAGVLNVFADLAGGLAQALGPLREYAAAFTEPWKQFIEIVARVLNIVLRLAGAVATLAVGFTDAASLSGAWKVLGEAIKASLVYVERLVSFVEDAARAFSAELNPALEDGATAIDKLTYVVKAFAITIALGGLFNAIGRQFDVSFVQILTRGWRTIAGLNWRGVFSALFTATKAVLVDTVAATQAFIGRWLFAGVTFVRGFITPFVQQVAVFITGNAAMAASSMVAGVTMAAAWVIATAGLLLIVVAVAAVYNNFSRLSDFFSNFGENVSKLFSFEGLADASKAVAGAIKEAFLGVFRAISGFFTGMIAGVIRRMSGIKTPEKINASTSTVQQVVDSRRSQQRAVFETKMSAASMAGADTSRISMPAEDLDSMSTALTSARDEMVTLSLEAAKFGDTGRKAFLAARADFDKLQQRLADGTIDPQKFEQEANRIRKTLRENLSLADVLSPEQIQQSAEDMRKEVESAMAKVREVTRGQDLGSDMTTDRFFPTSDAIKEAAENFASQYESELAAIEQKLQSGGFGTGQKALKEAQKAKEQAQADFNRNMGKIEADVSFANDIRKALEDAFLTPLQMYEKELKKIQDNKSLSPEEKSKATAMEQKKMVESTFGKTSGQSIREKSAMLEAATSSGAFTAAAGGDARVGAARASAEKTKVDIEKRQAVGLDATASQKLKAGMDNIADVFGVAGMSLQEIQEQLSPEEFAEYQEALRKNTVAVKESLGVEQSAAAKLAESRAKLDQALKDGVISQDEYNKALKKNRDEFLSSLGIDKSPAEAFEDATQKLKESAAELSPEEMAKGVKAAKDKLLDALGVPKRPADEAAERMKKLQEAFQKGQISAEEFARGSKAAKDSLLQSLGIPLSPAAAMKDKMNDLEDALASGQITTEEFAKGAQEAKDGLLQSLGIPLDPVVQLGKRMTDLQEAFDEGLISQEEFTRGQEEAKREMLPGSDEESPVKKFKRDMDSIDKALTEGLITDEEAGQRKMNLQAQLQEDMKPALDRLAPDRRAVESSDTRSKGGVDTFFRILRGNDNPSLKAQLEIAKNTRMLAEAAAEPEAAPVLANITGR